MGRPRTQSAGSDLGEEDQRRGELGVGFEHAEGYCV